MLGSELRLNRHYVIYYKLVAVSLLVTVGPLAAVLVFALLTVRAMQMAARQRERVGLASPFYIMLFIDTFVRTVERQSATPESTAFHVAPNARGQ